MNLVINEATCMRCGYPTARCSCPGRNAGRADFLPLPTPLETIANETRVANEKRQNEEQNPDANTAGPAPEPDFLPLPQMQY